MWSYEIELFLNEHAILTQMSMAYAAASSLMPPESQLERRKEKRTAHEL